MRIETMPFERVRTYYRDSDYIVPKERPQPSVKHASWCSCPHCVSGQVHIIRENGVIIYSNCINYGYGDY